MGYEPPLGELGQAFMSYAGSCALADDQLLEHIQRLEGRVLALELVMRALVRGGAARPDFRSTVLQTLDAEFRDRIGSTSSHVNATAAFVSTLQDLLPEREATSLKAEEGPKPPRPSSRCR
jgi:hypothetical protein